MKTIKYLVKIGRLAPILDGKFSREISLSLLKTADFSAQERPLVEVMIRLMEKDIEIDAVTVMQESKDQKIMLYYMDLIDSIDKKKYL